jgi:hypothetical protein
VRGKRQNDALETESSLSQVKKISVRSLSRRLNQVEDRIPGLVEKINMENN